MLEENLTYYQLLSEMEQKEFLQRIINLLNTSKHACGSIKYTIEKEEMYCKETNLKLPFIYPDNQPS
jgi:hypothetical protein